MRLLQRLTIAADGGKRVPIGRFVDKGLGTDILGIVARANRRPRSKGQPAVE